MSLQTTVYFLVNFSLLECETSPRAESFDYWPYSQEQAMPEVSGQLLTQLLMGVGSGSLDDSVLGSPGDILV